MGVIYKRTSPNGKYYIGKSIIPERDRWKRHIKESFDPNCDTYNTLLCKAIRKYGGDNFSLEILEDNIPNEKLAEKEIEYIKKFNAYYLDAPYLGYNMTRGGDGGLKYADEEILAKWDNNFGINDIAVAIGADRHTIKTRLEELGIDSIQRKERQSRNIKQKTRLDQNEQNEIIQSYLEEQNIQQVAIKCQLSDETIRKYLKINNIDAKQYDIARRAKKIYQIDLKTNKIINIFNSSREAAETLFPEKIETAKRSINDAASITSRRKTAYGYKWVYEENYKENIL